VSVKSPDVIGAGYDEVGGVSAAYLADVGGTSAEQGQLERKHLEDRSKSYRAAAAAAAAEGKTSAAELLNDLGGVKREIPMWTRFWDVWERGFMPRGMSMADPEARRILLLGAMVVGKTVAADWIAFYDGYILTTVLQSSWWTFLRAITIGAVMRSSLALFDAGMTRQKWYLNLAWRKRLTKYLMDKYFNHNTFYDVKNQDDRITDPEERLTEQVEQLSVSLTELWSDLLRPAFDISFNLIMLYRVMGSKAIGGMAGYMCVAAGLLQFIVPNFRQQVRKQFKLEGRFRFVHTRLVNHTESVAFFGGDDVEKEVCDGRLDELSNHVALTLNDSLRFNVFNNFMVRQTPDLAAFSLRMYFAMSMSTAVGSTIASTGEYIQQTVMRTFKSFGDAFELQETIGNFIGTLENVSDLMYTLEDLSSKQTARQGKGSTTRLGRSEDGSINFQDVDIVAPGKFLLLLSLLFFFFLS
jgi:ATP-binding cassette subfamily D (ALD) long-chain fatty acid import protein